MAGGLIRHPGMPQSQIANDNISRRRRGLDRRPHGPARAQRLLRDNGQRAPDATAGRVQLLGARGEHLVNAGGVGVRTQPEFRGAV